MGSLQSRKKPKRRIRNKKIDDLPSSFSIKLFIALSVLLLVLLMKKYDLSLGQLNVDSIYEVVYYNEDFDALKDKVFIFQENN